MHRILIMSAWLNGSVRLPVCRHHTSAFLGRGLGCILMSLKPAVGCGSATGASGGDIYSSLGSRCKGAFLFIRIYIGPIYKLKDMGRQSPPRAFCM